MRVRRFAGDGGRRRVLRGRHAPACCGRRPDDRRECRQRRAGLVVRPNRRPSGAGTAAGCSCRGDGLVRRGAHVQAGDVTPARRQLRTACRSGGTCALPEAIGRCGLPFQHGEREGLWDWLLEVLGPPQHREREKLQERISGAPSVRGKRLQNVGARRSVFGYTALWRRAERVRVRRAPRVCIVGPCTRGLSVAHSPRPS